MLPIDNVNKLRDLLQKLSQNIQAIASRQREEMLDYNVFYSTGIWQKEVIICNLLWDMLSPNGSHELGSLFLDLFNQTVLKNRMFQDEISNARVYRELYTDEGRRIDLTIETDKRFIPIEVKINAGDLPKQCIDYYKYIENKSIFKELKRPVLYYLTPNGHEPSENSLGELQKDENIILISFQTDIRAWLEKCLQHPEVNSRTHVKCILNQFRESIIGEGRTMKQIIHDDLPKELFNCLNNLNKEEKLIAARIWQSLDQKFSPQLGKNRALLWEKFIARFERKIFDKVGLKLSHDNLCYNYKSQQSSTESTEYWYKRNRKINGRDVDVGLFLYFDKDGAYIAYRIYKDKVYKEAINFIKNDTESREDYRELFPNSLTLQLPPKVWPWIHGEKFPQLNHSDIDFYSLSDNTLLLFFDEYLDDYLDNCFIPRIKEITGW